MERDEIGQTAQHQDGISRGVVKATENPSCVSKCAPKKDGVGAEARNRMTFFCYSQGIRSQPTLITDTFYSIVQYLLATWDTGDDRGMTFDPISHGVLCL